MRTKIKFFMFPFLIVVLLFLFPFLPSQHLKYDVEVVLKLIPFFAVDSHNKPVKDLKKDEIELFIAGKKSHSSSSKKLTSNPI